MLFVEVADYIGRDENDRERVILYKDVLSVDRLYRKVSIYQGCVCISDLELRVLEKLISNKGHVLKGELIQWLEVASTTTISKGYLNTIIYRLRRKLISATGAKLIRTRYGLGYSLTI